MKPHLPTTTAAVLALGLGAGALLGGCGSGTKTVTVAATPTTPATGTASTGTSSTPTSTATTPAQTGTAGGTAAPSTTRSAPEPAFTEQHESSAEGVSGAAAAVRAHGYTPNSTSEYHSEQTLRVLVGTRTGSGDGYGQQAFFFVGGHYIGTDAKEPSAKVKVVSQGDTEVTLAYPLYRRSDPLCCPGGGQATVRFQLNNGHLTAIGKIPPTGSSSALSRY
jgi:hypothetical protein